jgi:hypothetical protein
MRAFDLLVALFALVQLARYGRRALLCVAPSVQHWGEPGALPPTAPRLRAGEALEELGFVPLGTRVERGTLGAFQQALDAYAHPARGAYADVLDGPAREGARTVLFTPFPDGAAVLTATFQRGARSTARALVGSVPGGAGAALAAHEVAVRRFAATHGSPQVSPDLAARVEAARAWYRGEGRRELRRSNAVAFVNAALGLALLAGSAVNLLVRGLR